jgi:hypothetical protein
MPRPEGMALKIAKKVLKNRDLKGDSFKNIKVDKHFIKENQLNIRR